MAKRLKPADKQALKEWEALVSSIKEASSINPLESYDDTQRRRRQLEKDPEAWNKYYISMFCTSEPAPFHVEAARRYDRCDRLFEVLAWSRELAKTSRKMMDILRLALQGKIHNVLYVSDSADNAERLLGQVKAQLEGNQRILQDYGEQITLGKWESREFTARCGCNFRALGAGQSPRGAKHKNYRPDCIVLDDIDTDEETRNPERVKQKWKWIERALLPAMSVSGRYRISFLGNIIAPDCIIKRAIERAESLPKGIGFAEIINIRDKDGRSSWPAKNSEEDIDLFLSLVSYASGQAEFFNNPVSEGEIFTELRWGACPPLSQLDCIVAYADPSPSNRRATSKGGRSYKGLFLMGLKNGTCYIYTGYLAQVRNADFAEWFFEIEDWAKRRKAKAVIRFYIENNSLQDPFYEQVLAPMFLEMGKERGYLSITPDTRKKGEKFDRIEGNLEPLNRAGRLVFNIDERDNPHMRRLEEQFTLISPQMTSPADGPDCIEGGYYILNMLGKRFTPGTIALGGRRNNPKRY